MANGPNRGRRVAVFLLCLAAVLGLLIAPAGALADAPGASPSPSPSPSPTTSPIADVARQGPPRPAASPSPANPGLQNRVPQGQLIADLTALQTPRAYAAAAVLFAFAIACFYALALAERKLAPWGQRAGGAGRA